MRLASKPPQTSARAGVEKAMVAVQTASAASGKSDGRGANRQCSERTAQMLHLAIERLRRWVSQHKSCAGAAAQPNNERARRSSKRHPRARARARGQRNTRSGARRNLCELICRSRACFAWPTGALVAASTPSGERKAADRCWGRAARLCDARGAPCASRRCPS